MNYEDQKKMSKALLSGKLKGRKMSEKVKFKCTGCGVCCFNNEVLVNMYDLIRLRNALGLSTSELQKTGCLDYYIGPSSGLPVTRINFKLTRADSKVTKCPFLAPAFNFKDVSEKIKDKVKTKEEFEAKLEQYKKDPRSLESDLNGVKISKWLCGVHKDRPLICRLYPCGRLQRVDTKTKKVKEMYIFQDNQKSICEGFKSNNEITIGDFLKEQGVPEFREGSNKAIEIMNLLADSGCVMKTNDNAKNKIPPVFDPQSVTLFFLSNLLYNFDSFNMFSNDPIVVSTIKDKNVGQKEFLYVMDKIKEAVEVFIKMVHSKNKEDVEEQLTKIIR